MHSIEKVGVIGAGTMGAAIAAQVANAGLPVILLDIVPRTLTDKEKSAGLSLEDRQVRNRIVGNGLDRIAKLKPASFMSAEAIDLVTIGNLEDDLQELAFVDWIIEAVVENLEVKRALMADLDHIVTADIIVTSNTSGLPIASIIDGLSDSLRRQFFGTHFFNPPRYMKLLEVIRGEETDEAAVSTIIDFATQRLGKGVVFARDTPNFIANRLLSVHGSEVMAYALENGFRFEEVDAITGPLIGRPKTATFKLQDLVGIDVATHVAQNLHALIPDDPYRDVLTAPVLESMIAPLIEKGSLGRKSGKGFYFKTRDDRGRKAIHVLDPETLEYGPQETVRFPSITEVRTIENLAQRLTALFAPHHRIDDRAAQLAWYATGRMLLYAAHISPETAFDLASVDKAIRWGFSYEMGPFELWDSLGVATIVEEMRAEGWKIAPWVEEMLAAGITSFYRTEDGRTTGAYDWTSGDYRHLESDPRHIDIEDLHCSGKDIENNDSASLLDLGDGVLLLEFNSKMNSIDADLTAMIGLAIDRLDADEFRGLIIGNDGANFCVGANLAHLSVAVRAKAYDDVRSSVAELQNTLQRVRMSTKPVVAAVHGMALGGGAEVALAAARRVAHAESYMGLVEVGVGLIPAGGGVKEMARRQISEAARNAVGGDFLPTVQRVFETIAMAKVSTSAADARDKGFLGEEDRIVMNRDHLLAEAKDEISAMIAEGFRPQRDEGVFATGRDLYATLKLGVWSMVQAGYISDHDAVIGEKLAFVLTGGDASAAGWFSEDHFLECERDAFIDLLRTEKTQERIAHMLDTGKPLRN